MLSFKYSLALAALTITTAMLLRAEEPAAPPKEGKPACAECKPMGVQVVRNGAVVNAFQVGPRATTNTDILNFAYTQITINVGDKVIWTNQDFATHTVTSDAVPRVFDSGFMDNAQTFEFTFNTAGTFPYHCDIHPSMTSNVIVNAVGPTAPAITSELAVTTRTNFPFSYTLTATGNPAPALSFTNVPAGFNVNGATISGSFTNPGPVNVGLVAMNVSGTDNKTLVITVNQAPAITSALTVPAFVGELFTYTMQATGTPTPTLIFSNLPPQLTPNGATISGTFTAPGQATASLQAQNSAGIDGKTLTINISERPKITSPLTDSATIGLPFSYTLTATGTPTPTLSFGALPNGFQATGPTINGTFTSTGQVQIDLHASSAAGNDDKTLVITVGGATAAISSPLTATATVGVPFSYTLTATGNPAPTLSFTSIPVGFNVNGATLTGTFAAAGQVMVDLHASNAGGNDDKTLVITVDPATPPAITSPLTANATVGVPYSYTLTATGTPAPTLSFTNLPPGINATGPTLGGSFASAGQYSIDLHATNVGGADDETLVVTVIDAPVAPVITSPLTASAKVGALFMYTLTATGTPAPTLSFTNVPADLTMNATTIGGTFSVSGQFSVGLHATNSQRTDDKTLIITVAPADSPPAITSALTANAVVGSQFNYTLAATGSPAPVLTFTNVPTGFAVNGPALSGNFTTPGEVMVGLHATNTAGSDDKTLIITVAPAPIGPHITSPLTAVAIVGLEFSYTITASGDAPLIFGATLPSNLVLSGATISGTFTAPGTIMIPLTATNPAGTDAQTLVVTVLANTEGISGNWNGKLKGKLFDETGTTKPSVPSSGTIAVTFFQTGRDLTVRVTLTRGIGTKTYFASGRIGTNNLWTAGTDMALADAMTLSAQVNKNGKTIKGIGIIVNKNGAEEFSYSLARPKN